MKSLILKNTALSIFSILIFGCAEQQVPKQFTIADYEKAAAHMDRNLNSLVYHQISGSNFIEEDKLVYKTTDENGTQFLLVDAVLKNENNRF